jgi:hypothetical protein
MMKGFSTGGVDEVSCISGYDLDFEKLKSSTLL